MHENDQLQQVNKDSNRNGTGTVEHWASMQTMMDSLQRMVTQQHAHGTAPAAPACMHVHRCSCLCECARPAYLTVYVVLPSPSVGVRVCTVLPLPVCVTSMTVCFA